MSDEELRTTMLQLSIGALSLALLFGAFGVFILIMKRLPNWVPKRARRARWRPYGWAHIVFAAKLASYWVPIALDASPDIRLLSLVPMLGLAVIWVILLIRTRVPEDATESSGSE